MEQLMQILSELRPEVDFVKEVTLIDDQILDSFDIVTLVGELNGIFDIQIGAEDLVPVNFNSAAGMFEFIKRLKD
jgi:D-alanine--poly(phosphoribitol) ligase subunit 2